MAARLNMVEAALDLPGDHALLRLLELKNDRRQPSSSLEPAEGASALANTPLPQSELSLRARLRARAAGQRLRRFRPFLDLSEAEAATLRTLLDREHFEAGETILRRGSPSVALYLIEKGRAEVTPGCGLAPIILGPGNYFGEVGLLTGSRRTAEVIARSRLDVLRVSRDVYATYVRELPQVDYEIARVALGTVTDQLAATLGPE
jgi:monovalent cation:H+ antiporter-2, CPA2 family